MRVRVVGGVSDLQADLEQIVRKAPVAMRRTVREAGRVGNVVARDHARVSSRKHARLYPRTFTSEMLVNGLGGFYAVVYGPEPRGQGHLAPILENGSVNNPAHNNLARSADLMGPALAGEVSRLADGWFWS